MENFYSQKFTELKKYLPPGYQQKILEMLPGFKLWHIKAAFTNRIANEETLHTIFTAAVKLAETNIAKKTKAVKNSLKAFEAIKKM